MESVQDVIGGLFVSTEIFRKQKCFPMLEDIAGIIQCCLRTRIHIYVLSDVCHKNFGHQCIQNWRLATHSGFVRATLTNDVYIFVLLETIGQ